MFLAFLSTFIYAFSDVYFKRSFEYNIRSWVHEFCWYIVPISILSYFLIFTELFSWIPISAIIFFIVLVAFDTLQKPLRLKIYSEEKLSLILPYKNISKILIIISSFLLYRDVSYVSLIISIIAVITVIIWSINIKTLKLPRNFSTICILESLRAFWAILWWWLILKYWDVEFFIVYVVIVAVVTTNLMFFTRQTEDLRKTSISFWRDRFIGSLWWIGWLLSIFVIKNLWLSLSILLWFIGIAMTLVLSYLLMWDKPSKKNIMLTIVVSALIWIWYYFK